MSKTDIIEAATRIFTPQVFNANHPGPILHDVDVLLGYIGSDGVKANGKYNLLPIDAIAILDDRLARPLKLSLQRPQLKSHPYLQALHLLLRATGLTRVVSSGGTARLVVDEAMVTQWRQLNPTEQYFNLLEAAFVHATPDIIGERGGFFNNWLGTCLVQWQNTPARGVRFDLKRPKSVYVMSRKYYLVAFVDLFGLMEVEHPPAGSIQPWLPAALRHTDFGDAVFGIIKKHELQFRFSGSDDEATTSFGVWQPHFQPYSPQWRANLRLPDCEFREGVFHFKVKLGGMWREIAIMDQMSLSDLAYAILDSVNFESDHLYTFSYRNHLGKMITASHEYCDKGLSADDVQIGLLPLSLGQSMTFLFDFGDNWEFDVKLEKIDSPNPKMKAPKIVAKHGEAPEQYPDADY